jgi:SET domain-containing protein
MALLEKQLVVKRSAIPNSGKGLFTKKLIPKGSRIVEYKGKVSTWKNVDIDEGRNGYIYYINRNHVIDAKPFAKYLGRYANDAQGMTRVKGITNNSQYIADNMRVYIEAVKDIPAGGEILVAYGKEYWDVIKRNIKIDEMEKAKAREKKLKRKATKKVTKKKRATKNK